jgi:hypothetical protein
MWKVSLEERKTIDCTVTDPEPGIRDASGTGAVLGQSNIVSKYG